MHLESLAALGDSRRDAARRSLLYAAIEVFGDKGLKGASVREIARKAGQNIAAIAYYFGSKEGLYHATITCIVQELRLIMADEIRQIRALRERCGSSGQPATNPPPNLATNPAPDLSPKRAPDRPKNRAMIRETSSTTKSEINSVLNPATTPALNLGTPSATTPAATTASTAATATEALELLQAFLRGVYLRLLCRKEIMYLARLVIREQTQPSAGFEILYQQAFRDFHEGLCFLTGRVLGADPAAPQTIIRTHSLMGQVWFFAISRETILRRLGWNTLEGDHANIVADILMENVKLVLLGTAQTNRNKARRA